MKNTRLFNIVISAIAIMTLVISSFSAVIFAEDSTASGLQVVTGFTDVQSSHEKYVAISYLASIDVIGGYDDGTFKPEKSINRAEALKIILRGSSVESPEEFGESQFPDVDKSVWFAKYVMKAKELGIVKGNDNDGTFTPERQVNKAEFLKMLLQASNIKQEALDAASGSYPDIVSTDWYASYLYYATTVGIVTPDAAGNVEPAKALTRGEVAEMLYILTLIKSKDNTQFLLSRAEAEMNQVDVYIGAKNIAAAKKASELAVDLTQQAYTNLPENEVVLGAAKLAKAYDWVVDAFILAVNKQNDQAITVANQAIDKATEAWEVNNDTQPIAAHIKETARSIIKQIENQ